MIGTRKFFIAMGLGLFSAILCFCSKITGAQFVQVAIAIIGLYTFANMLGRIRFFNNGNNGG